eukprot:1861357-Rhodomonas_salina.2
MCVCVCVRVCGATVHRAMSACALALPAHSLGAAPRRVSAQGWAVRRETVTLLTRSVSTIRGVTGCLCTTSLEESSQAIQQDLRSVMEAQPLDRYDG